MRFRELKVSGAFEFTPTQYEDDRGVFLESFRDEVFAEALGHPFMLKQSNVSVSRKGVLRGIHFADVPPGQAKYVTAVSGSAIDFVVDLRTGSPTFGQWDSVLLDAVDRRAVYVGEGLGHAFLSLEDSTTISYNCNDVFRPEREHAVNPLDPEIALAIPHSIATPVLSDKDASAPLLSEAREQGLLPTAEVCLARRAELRKHGRS